MKKMKLTIIIPCSTDIRVKRCVESIDENVEIIVVLNGASKTVVNIVKRLRVKIVKTNKPNLGSALNIGIKNATNSKIVFIDADCTFQKGAIRKVFNALKTNIIVKSKVVFQYNNFASKIVASTRDYVNYNEPKPYNPFLAFDKNIKKYTGGYYFDKEIHWTEDADFYSRLKKSKIKVKYLYSAKAFHPPLSFIRDLTSAFRYGIGKRIRVEKQKSNSIGTHFSSIPDLINKKGILPGIYYLVWNITYIFGYLYQIVMDPYKVRNK